MTATYQIIPMGTAQEGLDYVVDDAVFEWEHTESHKEFSITLYDDSEEEGLESFQLELIETTAEGLSRNKILTVEILDDDSIIAEDSVASLRADESIDFSLGVIGGHDAGYVYTVVGSPQNGTLVGSGFDYTYTPNTGFAGNDYVRFQVSDGGKLSNVGTVMLKVIDETTPFLEEDGFVAFEAEDYASVERVDLENPNPWFFSTELPGYGGSGYVANEDLGLNPSFSDVKDDLQYKFQIQNAGEYIVWIRGYCEDSDSDRVNVTVGGNSLAATVFREKNYGKWQWIRAGAGEKTELSAGVHALELIRQEDGMFIDKFIVTNDLSFNPESILHPYIHESDRIGAMMPIANAGDDFEIVDVDSQPGVTVNFDGSLSSDDAGIVDYTWTIGGQEIASGEQASAVLEYGIYSVVLRTRDGMGNESSDTVNVSVLSQNDEENPDAPTGLRALDLSLTSIRVAWNPSEDNVFVSEYQIFKNGVLLGVTSASSFVIDGLSAGESAAISLRAVDSSANVSDSSDTLLVSVPALGEDIVLNPVADKGRNDTNGSQNY